MIRKVMRNETYIFGTGKRMGIIVKKKGIKVRKTGSVKALR